MTIKPTVITATRKITKEELEALKSMQGAKAYLDQQIKEMLSNSNLETIIRMDTNAKKELITLINLHIENVQKNTPYYMEIYQKIKKDLDIMTVIEINNIRKMIQKYLISLKKKRNEEYKALTYAEILGRKQSKKKEISAEIAMIEVHLATIDESIKRIVNEMFE